MPEIISIDLSNYCTKQCSFCYNHSRKDGNTLWQVDEVISFASDCISHGIKALSLGGGEPFEYDGKTYTFYEATQQQRKLERSIRDNRV